MSKFTMDSLQFLTMNNGDCKEANGSRGALKSEEQASSIDAASDVMGDLIIGETNLEAKSKEDDRGLEADNSSLILVDTTTRRTTTTLTLSEVSKRAALAGKRKIWDSNAASIDAAQSAVDHWENVYNSMRGLLIGGFHNVLNAYETVKTGATGLNHGLLLPVRDFVLLPTFGGIEHAVTVSVSFCQSPQAAQMIGASVEMARKVPLVGDSLIAPALCLSVEVTRKAWDVIQYPIPSRAAVHSSVDTVLSGTKWIISKVGSEVVFYAKRLDANITRTLVHTQWHVLGSGPYANLDKLHKLEVLDDLCERYLTLNDSIARYELACHIRSHNRQLYRDLVLSGLLRERGGEASELDEWLSLNPSYRSLERSFLLGQPATSLHQNDENNPVIPLYFRLPYVNGERPTKDVVYRRFNESERLLLEEGYQKLAEAKKPIQPILSSSNDPDIASPYDTIARWYEPDADSDVLLDERRYAVSFLPHCPSCHEVLTWTPPMLPKYLGHCCDSCLMKQATSESVVCLPPPITVFMRPTLWRFHGPGDEVIRAVWFLDTKRGLQPYGEESAAALEDAYMFLRWKTRTEHEKDVDGDSLLTIQVTSPDGSEQQLVQFSSLTHATAISKTLGGAISIFKRRVFRGVRQLTKEDSSEELVVFSDKPNVVEEVEAFSETWEPLDPPAVMENHFDVVKPAQLCIHEVKPEIDARASFHEPADHLVLIVHGIGEMLRSIDVFGLAIPNLSSIVDCSGYLRKNHHKVKESQLSLSSLCGQVEYLPVEWHEAFAVQSQRRAAMNESKPVEAPPTMQDISLRTVPQMRDFANDTLMDVLYFMSPQHHDTIIDIVTREMNIVVEKFRRITGFDGKVSVIGHSLGSVILWDILANPKLSPWAPTEANDPEAYSPPPSEPFGEGNQYLPINAPVPRRPKVDKDGSILPSFPIENAFFLGSPIPVFLMIRNQQLQLSFCLPGCPRVFNIFHPYDPVAYRIEPVLTPSNSDIQPRIIPHWNGGYRVQYQTKRLWKRIVDETVRTEHNMATVFEAQMSRIGLLEAEERDFNRTPRSSSANGDVPVCGNLNQGKRIDYMLQEKEIELSNEYLSAFAAHSSYWVEKDLSLFIARQIVRSSFEESGEGDNWDALEASD